mgnify:CR=1 FL=1
MSLLLALQGAAPPVEADLAWMLPPVLFDEVDGADDELVAVLLDSDLAWFTTLPEDAEDDEVPPFVFLVPEEVAAEADLAWMLGPNGLDDYDFEQFEFLVSSTGGVIVPQSFGFLTNVGWIPR